MTATTFAPTAEQQDALDKFATGESLAIEAGAGTGKTSTLKMLAESTTRRGQYIAFNKAIVEEAKTKMPRSVSASTAHGLAYRNVIPGTRYDQRLKNSARMKSTEIAQRLGIGSGIKIVLQDGSEKFLSKSYLAGVAMRGVIRFCQSADLEPDAKHVPYIDGIDLPPGARANNITVARALVTPMRKAWADIMDEEGSLPFKHDHYLKMWHLSGPKINAEYIMFDEAQDANPVLVDIVRQQTHAQLVWVGDSQQQIYSFTGAINALAQVGAKHESFLSQSFRFGPAIAAVANTCLRALNAPITLTGTDSVASTVGAIETTDCVILCRTNATAVRHLLDALRDAKKAHLIGGGREVVDFAKGARSLMQDGWTSHPELACFSSWGEVQGYVEQDEQGGDLRLLVNLIDEFTADKIIEALEVMPRERDADLVISTAHKAKGREWDSVQLADDFQAEPSGEELRLLYVAVTRAKLRLDITAIRFLNGGFAPEQYAWVNEDDSDDDRGDRPATESEAHAEWHRNAGVPMGTPGCPWDACHVDDYEEENGRVPLGQLLAEERSMTMDEAHAAVTKAGGADLASLREDLAGRPGIFHLWGDGLMLGEHTDSKVAIETASKLYSAGRFRVVNVYTDAGDLVVQYEA